MKKISLASGVLALGLFAACSNDAPEIKTNTPDNGSLRYIAVNIGTPETRVSTGAAGTDATNPGNDNERAIDAATLYLVPATGNAIIARNINVNFDGTSSSTAIKFAIDEASFKTLTSGAGTAKYKLYIVANAQNNGFVMNTFDDKATVTKTGWGDGESNKGRAGYFFMSNDDEIEITLPAYSSTGEQDGSSSTNAWMLNTTSSNVVTLTRLAARFDLLMDAKGEYSFAVGDKTANFTVVGAGLQNINHSSYLFRQMSPSGKIDDAVTFGRDNGETKMHLVSKIGSWYDVEKKMSALSFETDLAAYMETTGENAITVPQLYTYAFESSVNGCITATTTDAEKKALLSYKHITYMAFQTEFTYPGYTDQTDKTDFVAYKGVILGFIDELKKQDFVASGLSDADRVYVNNALIELRGTDGSGMTSTALRNKGFDYFAPKDGKYYCYYVHPILNTIKDNDNKEPEGCCKYRVRRNRLYNMDLESISKVGHDGEYKPDQIEADAAKYIGLNVTVKDWTIVNNSFNF